MGKENAGCEGGDLSLAAQFLESNNAVLEADYPYTSTGGKVGKCNASAKPTAVKVTSYIDVTANSADALKAALATEESPFTFYHSGVLTGSACGYSLDHGVLAVG